MGKYGQIVGNLTPSAAGVKNATDILAALAPPATGQTALAKSQPSRLAKVKAVAFKWAPGLVGVGVGAFVWKKHRWLGALAGHAIGTTVMPIWRGGAERKKAIYQLAVEGAAIGGALWLGRKSALRAAGGFVVGGLAALVVTGFIKGSPANDAYKNWKAA